MFQTYSVKGLLGASSDINFKLAGTVCVEATREVYMLDKYPLLFPGKQPVLFPSIRPIMATLGNGD